MSRLGMRMDEGAAGGRQVVGVDGTPGRARIQPPDRSGVPDKGGKGVTDQLPAQFIEVDGYAYHSSPEQLQRDNARRNALEVEGWQFLVYTWLDVTREPRRVAAEIAAFYGR